MKKLKILCFDIEGGHGGSSRSLFYALKYIAKKKIFNEIDITVICKKNSWVKNEYKEMGIDCLVYNNMPKFTPLLKLSRNFYQLFYFIIYLWPQSKSLQKKMRTMKNFDVIHFNHVSLSLLAIWCKFKNIGKSRVMHMRTLPPVNLFSKILFLAAKKSCNDFVYISENEKIHLHSLIGNPEINESIIYNPLNFEYKVDNNFLKNDKRFKIGVLSNFSFNRGVDRILEIFEKIPLNKRKYFVFILAGDMTLEKDIPNIPNSFFKNKKSFADFVISKGYGNNFIFLGQLQKPENVISKIHVLLKPTRLNNPWGRDILEALSIGKPVISVGQYKKFVETNKTGLLQSKFNANEVVKWIIKLEEDRNLLRKFSSECKKRVRSICNPENIAEKLLKIWTKK